MITTVTTTTVTTVATAFSLGLIGVLALLALLVNKEVISTSSSEQARRLSKAINVTLVPLLIAFAVTATAKLIEILM
jgi:hypothetical protein